MVLIFILTILIIILGVLVYRKTIPKINSLKKMAADITKDMSNAYKDGYLVNGELLIEFIISSKDKPIQIQVETLASKGKGGMIYNWNIEEKKALPTYNTDLSKQDDNYINPGSAYMTTVKKDKDNNVISIFYQQK